MVELVSLPQLEVSSEICIHTHCVHIANGLDLFLFISS